MKLRARHDVYDDNNCDNNSEDGDTHGGDDDDSEDDDEEDDDADKLICVAYHILSSELLCRSFRPKLLVQTKAKETMRVLTNAISKRTPQLSNITERRSAVRAPSTKRR